MSDIQPLSEREREILCLVVTGLANKEIASALSISPNTVKVHLRNIFEKIGAASRTEAAMYAVREGLVDGLPVAPIAEAAAFPVEPARPWWKTVRVWLGVVLGLAILAGAGLAGWLLPQASPTATPPGATASLSPTPTSVSRWHARAPMLTARSRLAAAAYENQIYAIGGETDEGVTGALERYDPRTNTWTALQPKPVPVADIGAAVIGGKIYIPGGRTASGQVARVVEAYDPRQDSWTERASMPGALSGYAMVAFEGKLYVFGGWDGQRYVNTAYGYDPAQNTWRELTSMPTTRAFAGAGVAGGRIYVVGGYDGKQALPVNEEYVPELDLRQADPWLRSEPLPAGRYRMGIAALADSIYLIGGEAGPGVELMPIRFAPQDGRWVQFAGPDGDLGPGLGLVALESQLYAMGGSIAQVPQAGNLQYQAIYTILLPLVR